MPITLTLPFNFLFYDPLNWGLFLTLTERKIMSNSIKWFYRKGGEFTGLETSLKNVKLESADSLEVRKCFKCGGRGGADAWRHTGWTCYRCGGSGKESLKKYRVYSAEKLAKLEMSANKAAKRKADKKEAERLVASSSAWSALEPAVSKNIKEGKGNFFFSLSERLDKGYPLTDKQIAAVKKIAVDQKVKKGEEEIWAGSKSLSAGRQELTGLLVNVKVVEGQWGAQYKALYLLSGGCKVYGTIPSGVHIKEDLRSGMSFKATVTVSDSDKQFGVFKRPSAASFSEVSYWLLFLLVLVLTGRGN